MERAHIEACILNNDPMPRIASQFGLSVSGIQRHKANCSLARVDPRLPGRSRIDVLANLLLLATDAARIQNAAEEEGSFMAAAQLIGRRHALTEAIEKAQGPTSDDRPIDKHPEFGELCDRILASLDAFPDAKASMVRALAPRPRGGS